MTMRSALALELQRREQYRCTLLVAKYSCPQRSHFRRWRAKAPVRAASTHREEQNRLGRRAPLEYSPPHCTQTSVASLRSALLRRRVSKALRKAFSRCGARFASTWRALCWPCESSSRFSRLLSRFVSVLVMDVKAVWYRSVRLFPNFAMQSNQRRVVAVFVTVPDLFAPFDASVTHAIIPGRTDASGINPRRSIHTG